jgi:hypothetical protein
MPNYSMSDPEYWQNPPKYQPLADASDNNVRFFLLGPDAPETPTAIVLEMAPGHVITRHAHECERFEVVVKGSIDVGDKVLYPGDVMTARPNEFYGPKVVGPDGCTTVEIFSNQTGATAPLYETEDGSVLRVDYTAGDPRPQDPAGMEGVAERVAAVLAERAARDA